MYFRDPRFEYRIASYYVCKMYAEKIGHYRKLLSMWFSMGLKQFKSGCRLQSENSKSTENSGFGVFRFRKEDN